MDDLEKMRVYKQQGFYCSQILLLLGLDLLGKTNPDLVGSVHGLAGGLGFNGELCGGLTGGACLLGLYAGKKLPTDEEDPRLDFMIEDLVKWFKADIGEKYGGCRCDDIIGKLPGNQATHCPAIVAATYQKVKELLVENGFELTGSRINPEVLHSLTESVCPICLKRIEAQRVFRGDCLFLQKECSEHGFFETPIWRGNSASIPCETERIPAKPESPLTIESLGCPFDCGLCPEHRQQPCCVLLEVTQQCDLTCPVCFASSGTSRKTDPDLETIRIWYQMLLDAGGPFNIQLSGGEPCLRDDLPEIISMGREMGFSFFQVNTNGLRIGRDLPYLEALKKAGVSTVYLQFDGIDDGIYLSIRGKKLLDKKNAAIENCRILNIGVVLVPTIKPGVNDQAIGNIIRFALSHHPVVRGVHFQPISYFGRYPTEPSNFDRITLPEIISAIHEQSDGLIGKSWFSPSGGPNRFCSFNCNFVVMEDGSLKPIIKRQDTYCCSTPQDASIERIKAQSFVARQWVSPEKDLPEQVQKAKPSLGGWDSFLSRAKTHLFSISGMAFQDAWTLDLDRLHDCYIMVVSPDNRLIPFCAYNLTGQKGTSLYRDVSRSK